MHTTTILAWPGCTWGELSPALGLLAPHRRVQVLAADRSVRVGEGYTLTADAGWDALADAREVLVPGGPLDPVWDDHPLHDALRACLTAGAHVGAVCNGAALLARTGALAGRRVTHTCADRYAPRPAWDELRDAVDPALADTVWVDEDVVVDGALITAKPWAAIAFGKAFATHTGALPAAAAAAQARYLAGARDLPGADPYERWLVELTQIEGVPTTAEHVRAHVAWLATLEADGRLPLAGPLPEQGAGRLVLRVASRAEAEAIMGADPFVRAGVRRAALRRWLVSCADNGHLGRL